MKITQISKLKNGTLYEALQKAGETQRSFALKCGLSIVEFGEYCNMTRVPTEKKAYIISLAFGNLGVYIDIDQAFPAGFKGVGRKYLKKVQTVDIPDNLMIEFEENMMLCDQNYFLDPVEDIKISEMEEVIEKHLTPRKRAVIKKRFGVDCSDGERTLESIADEFGVSRVRIQQLEYYARRDIRKIIINKKKIKEDLCFVR